MIKILLLITSSAFLLKGIIIGGVAFVGGGIVSYFIWNIALRQRSKGILEEAKVEAEVIKKDKILQAKEKFLQLKTEHEKFINERNNKLAVNENRFKQKETALSQKFEEVQRSRKEIDAIRENLNNQLLLIEKRAKSLKSCIVNRLNNLKQYQVSLPKRQRSNLPNH